MLTAASAASPGTAADGYAAYQQRLPKLAGIQRCAAHVIRRYRAVARLGPGSLQSWAADVIEIIYRSREQLTALFAEPGQRVIPEVRQDFLSKRASQQCFLGGRGVEDAP